MIDKFPDKWPILFISSEERLHENSFTEFEESMNDDHLPIYIHLTDNSEVYFLHERFIPSGIFIIIERSYFDHFLKEAGKDHFHKLKVAITDLTRNILAKQIAEPTIKDFTGGMFGEVFPYSLRLAICADASGKKKFRLMLPNSGKKVDYDEIVNKFLDFLYDFHMGLISIDDMGITYDMYFNGRSILVHMDSESKKIELVKFG